MLRLRDLYTKHEVLAIQDSDNNNVTIGSLINDFEVHQYTDTRGLAVANGFVISLSQRLIVPAALTTASPAKGYVGYPAYITNTITPISVPPGDILELIDYTPITVNSSVDSSVNSSVGANTSDSKAYTSGSSTSVTNSYDVNVNLSKGGGISGGYGHSQTDTVDHSQTVGSDKGADHQLGSSDAMSIKEWGSYLAIDVTKQAPTWTWTQEYPWNTYVYHDKESTGALILPPFIQNRLFLIPDTGTQTAADPPSGATAAPPSAISMRGLTFLSKARWAYFPQSADGITFDHTVTYATGEHTLAGSSSSNALATVAPTNPGTAKLTIVSIALSPAGSTTVDQLSTYGLDPLGTGSRSGSLVCFTPSQFRIAPKAATDPFTLAPSTNDMLVQGTGGFTFSPDLDAVFQADVTKAQAELDVAFKITNTQDEYSLYLKHWKLSDTGCTLTITVNEAVPAIVRHVDAGESEGGSDNVLRVVLRNLDYSSSDFYDYLSVGINRIKIQITSDDATSTASSIYAIRSLAIG